MRALLVMAVMILAGCCNGPYKYPGCVDVKIQGMGPDVSSPRGNLPEPSHIDQGPSPQDRGGFLRWIVWLNI